MARSIGAVSPTRSRRVRVTPSLMRVSRFDHALTLADIKRLVNSASLPADADRRADRRDGRLAPISLAPHTTPGSPLIVAGTQAGSFSRAQQHRAEPGALRRHGSPTTWPGVQRLGAR